MSTKLIRIAAVSCIAIGVAFSPAAFAGPQQEKMTLCNKEAKEKSLAGDERKAFMKECLSAKKADRADAKKAEATDAKKPADSAATTPQQEKMKACNKEAGDKALKGDERKKFMSACLKG